MAETTGCTARVGDTWHKRPCGKPFKNDEQRDAGLCGTHLAGRRRSENADAQRKIRYAARDAAQDRAEKVAGELATLLGLDRLAVSHDWDGRLLLTVEAAERIRDRLEG